MAKKGESPEKFKCIVYLWFENIPLILYSYMLDCSGPGTLECDVGPLRPLTMTWLNGPIKTVRNPRMSIAKPTR